MISQKKNETVNKSNYNSLCYTIRGRATIHDISRYIPQHLHYYNDNEAAPPVSAIDAALALCSPLGGLRCEGCREKMEASRMDQTMTIVGTRCWWRTTGGPGSDDHGLERWFRQKEYYISKRSSILHYPSFFRHLLSLSNKSIDSHLKFFIFSLQRKVDRLHAVFTCFLPSYTNLQGITVSQKQHRTLFLTLWMDHLTIVTLNSILSRCFLYKKIC